MMKCFLHAKIHQARVTEANLHYVGSVTIARDLLKKTGIQVGEKVLITNNTNGNRLETYVIAGEKGQICMNGATAHLMNVGDEVIIMAFAWAENHVSPCVILVNQQNECIEYLHEDANMIR